MNEEQGQTIDVNMQNDKSRHFHYNIAFHALGKSTTGSYGTENITEINNNHL
jgi:hypothetical protein